MCRNTKIKESFPSVETKPTTAQESKQIAPTHSEFERNTSYDWLIFLAPLLGSFFTNVFPIYVIGIARIFVNNAILSLHYQFIDKDNYLNKWSQKQIRREGEDYMTGVLLHMWTQVALQIIFPGMFFTPNSELAACLWRTFLSHVFMVEPIYYFAHRWLHVPEVMKRMHGFHHLSIVPMPTTGLVQNFEEHFIYIATFGPAFLAPFLLFGCQHWMAIGAYLVAFDICNAYGHTHIKIRSWIFESKYSPMHYLFYTPEFHLGHHAYFNANYCLFMPIWDYMLGTARSYKKKEVQLLPAKQQNFVFIGHNGGLGHILTIPEFCFYNVYDKYRTTGLPLKLEFFIMHILCHMTRLFMDFYYCTRYCVANEYIGRIICLTRSPWDYFSPKSYNAVNKEIIELMRKEHKNCGTRYFGLGNLNKMKQLNDGGVEIAKMIKEDPYLSDKNIRVWTGDTMTVASIYHQIADIPKLDKFFFIGAGGKVGTAVCKLLTRSHPNLKIRIFSKNPGMEHPNISYTTDLSEMAQYKVVMVGKMLSGEMYSKALSKLESVETRYFLDYTVPSLPIAALEVRPEDVQHVRVGLLKTYSNNPFLKGSYDTCMGHDENHIVPCHFGCLLNTVQARETNEVGEVDLNDVERLWKLTVARGFENISFDYK
ncbi:WAX2 C-terminal domain [Seminavis robusta]|uniref:WAX2 C-terminal domain n=1 Tax=Seminavis robusta TaxID=568900 RepID=A0A9N8DIY9_9STRA|nr:WAX2 C-terminal domain [Seminavis robusta]|eukprot:Sro110_g055090.1 WAX2 C-terminal domain (651) ;mRNA; f:108392-110344